MKHTTVKRGTQIRLEGVTKDYGLAAPAVDTISLTIEPGEFITLLGPSGSGKTTTLNLIAGFETLTDGAIFIDSQEVGRLPPHKRHLGMLFQNYALFPHMTVARNIAYPLRERRMPKDEIARRVQDVLELVQLRGRDDAYPAQLSGGQQQRVALARAIVFEPRALLLDEPLSALDRRLRANLQVELRRIHREVGATFIFVTHDQEEAMSLSDRIALFNEGRIEQVGTPEDLYAKPETLFAARFLGESNVFHLDDTPASGFTTWEEERWTIDGDTTAVSAQGASRTALVVRPEAVSLNPTRADVPADANAVCAKVRDVDYAGSYRTLILGLGNADIEGRARLPASVSAFSPGDEVTMWWRPGAQRIVSKREGER
ncbi:ABC transporter ATP-binding protein [Chelatococcus sp. GCM10030263]|uniref:ABC transporter ATP-binding protein n=1 Tax=Chelatococcus sp. GCM10030263 TaxID=3273387 RepID=UPI00361A9458